MAEPPRFMKAAVLRAPASLEIETVPVPAPRSGEVLLRVAACGVCHTDLHVLKGEVAFPRPCVLGHEISGTVVAIGAGTRTGFEIGDRVVGAFIMPCESCPACDAGRDDLCEKFFRMNRLRGVLYDGESRLHDAHERTLHMYSMAGLAEYCVAPVGALARLPEGLAFHEAAILGCAMLTGFGAVHRTAQLAEGASVAVIGAGGVGSSIIQLAAAAGASQIIAIDVHDAKLHQTVKLGATGTVNSRECDPVEAVKAMTNGTGVEFVFEAIGMPGTLEQGLRMLADGGRVIAVGIAAGEAAASVEITPLVRRGQGLIGSYGARTRADLPRVIELAGRGSLDPAAMISAAYPLERVAEAFADLDAGRIVGRAIVRVGD